MEFYCRNEDEYVATLGSHPPVGKQVPQRTNSGLNSAMEKPDQVKGSDLFAEPTEQEKEADQEFIIQMLRRRRRKIKEGDVPSVTEEGETRKVSKRSFQESEDNFGFMEKGEKQDEVQSEAEARKRLEKKIKVVGNVEEKVDREELYENIDEEHEKESTEKPKKVVRKKKKVKKMVRRNAEGPFVLDEAGIDLKYSKSPEHAERIKNLPRREKEIFLHVEKRICGKRNPKFLQHLFSSNDAEETIKAFQLTPKTYEELVGESFEPVNKGVATAIAKAGRGTDTIEEAVTHTRSDAWIEGITIAFNQIHDFVMTTEEFRNVDWLRAEAADLDLVLGYFFLWLAPQQGSNALGKRYCPRTLKNMKTKIQNLLEHFLKRKDFNLSGAEARFTKSMYEAKQNLTAKRAGGPGEGVQGDRERQAFTTADQKKIDAWIMTKVISIFLSIQAFRIACRHLT